jgi:hypothetical protein
MKRLLLVSAPALIALTACEEKTTSFGAGDGTEAACPHTTETLAGTTWLYNKLSADGTGDRTPDNQTRLKFYDEGGKTKAKYTVGSFSDVYTYDCQMKGEELYCAEELKLVDYCKSMLVVDKDCTVDNAELMKMAPEATPEALAEAHKEAAEAVAKYKEGEHWKQFVFNNNNLGNKLRGKLYAKVKDKKCYVQVTDMYSTIYEGKFQEDSNPVGTDQFVETKEDFMWEHCTDSGDMVATKAETFPESEEQLNEQACFPNSGCSYTSGETAYYHYIGQDGRVAKEGCTYSYDTYVDWKPVSKDVTAEIVDFNKAKEVRWGFNASHTEPGAHVVEMVRYATCDGKKEQVEVACNLVTVQ